MVTIASVSMKNCVRPTCRSKKPVFYADMERLKRSINVQLKQSFEITMVNEDEVGCRGGVRLTDFASGLLIEEPAS